MNVTPTHTHIPTYIWVIRSISFFYNLDYDFRLYEFHMNMGKDRIFLSQLQADFFFFRKFKKP